MGSKSKIAEDIVAFLPSGKRFVDLFGGGGSYWDYEYKDGDVVYCDPPYEGTAGYNEAAAFDSKAFYNWVAAAPFPVYFSSYEISDSRFYPLWQKEKAQLLSGQGSGKKKLETIYSNHPCPPCGTVQMMLFPEAAQ